MPWWGWLLTGVGAALLSVLVLWLIFRKKTQPTVDRVALLDSQARRLAEERDAETAARKKAEATAKRLELELRGIAERKKKKLEDLDDKTAQKFRDLTDDPDSLLDRVDRILRGEA